MQLWVVRASTVHSQSLAKREQKELSFLDITWSELNWLETGFCDAVEGSQEEAEMDHLSGASG